MMTPISAQDNWHYSADELEQITIKGESARKFYNNVKIYKKSTQLLTDTAVQLVSKKMLILRGNTIMIDDLDTLSCDSMYYWTSLDSGFAMGNVRFVQPSKNRKLFTDVLHYWKSSGYRGSSFRSLGTTKIIDDTREINSTEIFYDDSKELMSLTGNSSIEDNGKGLFGYIMNIQYSDTNINEINITENAFAFNKINARINSSSKSFLFQDEMNSKNMQAEFANNQIINLNLFGMAETKYHVIDDSLLMGTNEASGDSIMLSFKDGNIDRIKVFGGARGQFNPQKNNTKVDTIITYKAEKIDYLIEKKLSYLNQEASVDYQGTRLSSGEIEVNWDTNILNATLYKNEYPMIESYGESPMSGEKMNFDLISKRGKINKGKTNFNESYYHGNEIFRDEPNIFHVNHSMYTSCELDTPHFFLGSKKMKMLPGDRIIAKPLWLFVYDIPVIGVPLAIFPNKGGKRHSGWIMPSFDSYNSIGTGFKNLGYYFAPNNYFDSKMLVNFFDKEGFNFRSFTNYKKRHGIHWYDFQYQGTLNSTFKRTIINNDIYNILNKYNTIENWTLNWTHSQKFDPTQRMSIQYNYISSRDVFNQNEVDINNRLKQNLNSSFNYNKNWKVSSLSIGFNEFRDLSIENNWPINVLPLYENIYKSYKFQDGPKINFNSGLRKIFGPGDKFYNSFAASYSLKSSYGRKDFMLIRQDDQNWSNEDTIKIKKGGVKHYAIISAPQNMFGWLTFNPSASIREDWVLNYKSYSDISNQVSEVQGFKRRLLWESSLSLSSKIYGLFPIKLGKLNALRHVISPGISLNYKPDFSKSKFGGDNYFQQSVDGDLYDYFSGSYVGATPIGEKQIIRFTINNVFQGKIKSVNGSYKKLNIMTWNMTMDYNTLKEDYKLSDLKSSVRLKNFSGSDLFNLGFTHSFYHKDNNNIPLDSLLIPWKGELPTLKHLDLTTSMKFSLNGYKFIIDEGSKKDDENNEKKQNLSNSNNRSNTWETNLTFNYKGNWDPILKLWEYKFTLKTNSSFNLSKSWSLTYLADFDLVEKSLNYHRFKFYRSLHCWEFDFNWWPNGTSSGYSLKINVKNPDLKDIKIESSDRKRGFGSY